MKIAIQGHLKRGKEVIQILESLGGKNVEELTGTFTTFYCIDDKGEICDYHKNDLPSTYKLYTLEEFEKEFPFKVGDKVTVVGLPDFPKVITKMVWDCDEILYSFEGLNNTWFGAKALKKFEMKEERNITLTLDKAQEWYKKGGELKEIALQAFNEKELNPLPKSWEEFCETFPIDQGEAYISSFSRVIEYGHSENRNLRGSENMCPSRKSAEAHLAMIQLEQLRDCWWNGWEPKTHESVFAIKFSNKGLSVYNYGSREFLSFPTREMAEEFLECFRDLIEKAGDLI